MCATMANYDEDDRIILIMSTELSSTLKANLGEDQNIFFAFLPGEVSAVLSTAK